MFDYSNGTLVVMGEVCLPGVFRLLTYLNVKFVAIEFSISWLPKIVTKLRPYNELDYLGFKSTDMDNSWEFTTYDTRTFSMWGGALRALRVSIPAENDLNPYI